MAAAKLATFSTTAAVIGCFLLRARRKREHSDFGGPKFQLLGPAVNAVLPFAYGIDASENYLPPVHSYFLKKACCCCESEHASPPDFPSFRPSSLFYAGATRIVPLVDAIASSERVLRHYREVCGAPAIVAAVSVDGRIVWETGLGYADVEQGTHAKSDTVMRIASISKCMTAAMVAYFVDRGWLDLDKPVHEYIGKHAFSFKNPDGSVSVITTRQLLSHMAGVRHYRKSEQNDKGTQTSSDVPLSSSVVSSPTDAEKPASAPLSNSTPSRKSAGDGQYPEFYLNNPYKTAQESLIVFKDDPLLSQPGEKFHYTTFGYTLLSAVLEKAAELAVQNHNVDGMAPSDKKAPQNADSKLPTPETAETPATQEATVRLTADNKTAKLSLSFLRLFELYFVKKLGLLQTCLDNNEKIIPNRARYYHRDAKTHALKNSPEVDNSCKWAGGGVVSSAGDLVRFGNALLMSQQSDENSVGTQTYLRPASVRTLWQSVKGTENVQGSDYGLGFALWPRNDWFRAAHVRGTQSAYMQNVETRIVYHSGGAVGASSMLMILPRTRDEAVIPNYERSRHPSGVVIAIICNLQDVRLYEQALELCSIFDKVQVPPVV